MQEILDQLEDVQHTLDGLAFNTYNMQLLSIKTCFFLPVIHSYKRMCLTTSIYSITLGLEHLTMHMHTLQKGHSSCPTQVQSAGWQREQKEL